MLTTCCCLYWVSQKSIQVFHNMLWKNLNELFGQPNISTTKNEIHLNLCKLKSIFPFMLIKVSTINIYYYFVKKNNFTFKTEFGKRHRIFVKGLRRLWLPMCHKWDVNGCILLWKTVMNSQIYSVILKRCPLYIF